MIILTATVVLSTITYGLLIEPLARTFSKLNRQIRSTSLKLERNHKMLRHQEIIRSEYNKYRGLIKPTPSDEEEIASMLKVIESTARSNKIDISNIRPQPVKDRGYYKDFTFELVSEAELKEIVKFIYDLQGSKNLLRVRKFTLSSSSSKNRLKAVMEIVKPAIKLQ